MYGMTNLKNNKTKMTTGVIIIVVYALIRLLSDVVSKDPQSK